MQQDTFGPQIYQHQQFLRALAYKLTRHSEDAEDLVQETFFKAIKNQTKYQPGTNLGQIFVAGCTRFSRTPSSTTTARRRIKIPTSTTARTSTYLGA
jgi:hypothetical protein